MPCKRGRQREGHRHGHAPGRELPERADRLGRAPGWQRLLTLLENLQRHYGEERYRPCSLLRQRALLESSYES